MTKHGIRSTQMHNKTIVILFIFLFANQVFAQRDSSHIQFSLGLGKIGAFYFLHKDSDAENRTKPASFFENSGTLGVLDMKIKQTSFFISGYIVNRNFTVPFKENNGFIETYHAKSYLSCFQAGVTYPIKENKTMRLYAIGAFVIAKGWYTRGTIDRVNVQTGQKTTSDYYPHHSLNVSTWSLVPGVGIDINVYKRTIYSKTQLTYAGNWSQNNFTYGVNRLMISSSIGFVVFRE